MDIGSIPGRDRVDVDVDDKTGQVVITRVRFGGSERDIDGGVEVVHIDREDLPQIIKFLQSVK